MAAMSAAPVNLINVEDAVITYGEKSILDHVSLGLNVGDRVGVVGRNDSGAAMINRQIVDVGSAIEGVTVIGIERNAAWLEYKGDRRLLHVGKSTE